MDIIAPNIAVDFLILCLPMFEIRNLHISQRQSIALGSVFLLGTGVIAASGIRLYCHIQFVKQGSNVDITSEKSFPLQSTLSCKANTKHSGTLPTGSLDGVGARSCRNMRMLACATAINYISYFPSSQLVFYKEQQPRLE